MIELVDLFAPAPQPTESPAGKVRPALLAETIAASGVVDLVTTARVAASQAAEAARTATAARAAATRALALRDQTIAELVADGVDRAAVASACGLTQRRVSQIVAAVTADLRTEPA